MDERSKGAFSIRRCALIHAPLNNQSIIQIKEQFEFSYLFLKKLPSVFLESSLDVQHEIIGSIFPEKILFSENKCRTKRVNEVAQLIRTINRPFGTNKKGQFCKKTKLSYEVAPTGIEPVFKV